MSPFDDIGRVVAGPARIKIFGSERRKDDWDEQLRVHIIVSGDLCWRVPPPEPLCNLESWSRTTKVFDLIRGEDTEVTRLTSRTFEIAPGGQGIGGGTRRIHIETETEEESLFWQQRIELLTDSWDVILKKRDKKPPTVPRPTSIYDVTILGNEKDFPTSAGSKVLEALQKIRTDVVEPILEAASSANDSGITKALESSPLVGVAFSVVGYGLAVASRYAKDKKDLPEAQVLALDLFKQCLENIVSLEKVPGKTPEDEVRRTKVVRALSELETAIRILNEQQRRKGRAKLLDAFFKEQGEATKMLEITLDSCRSNLGHMETHSALMGVDLIRAMLTKVITMVDSEREGGTVSDLEDRIRDIQVDVKSLVSAVVNGGRHTSSLLEGSLLDHIRKCQRIDDFVRVYDSEAFQYSLRRLEVAQGDEEKDAWACKWAKDFRKQENELAFNLDKDRKLALELLYIMCDHWRDENGDLEKGAVSEDDIVNKFQEKRIERILGLCLVMDRAQALYKMQKPGSNNYGMHWYAKQHEQLPEWKEITEVYRKWNRPTLNMRIIWLMDLDRLDLKENEHFKRWTMPAETPFE